MGENDVTITARDMYDQIVGMRDDVQRIMILLSGTADKVTDHETRLRRIEDERQDYITEDDLTARTGRLMTLSATLAGIVSVIIAGLDFLISHH